MIRLRFKVWSQKTGDSGTKWQRKQIYIILSTANKQQVPFSYLRYSCYQFTTELNIPTSELDAKGKF